MSFHVGDGEAFQALHYNRVSKRHDGWGIYEVSAGECAVTINTGQLGTGTDTLTVTGGTALLDGADATISATVVNVPPADTAPRKDVIVIYADGTVGRVAGDPEPKEPTDRPLTISDRPAPPSLKGTDAVPLGVVNVPAGATAITATEIVDTRPQAFVGGSGDGTAAVGGRYPDTGTITADGTTAEFRWSIGSQDTIEWGIVNAATSDASTDFQVNYDNTTEELIVTYATEPVGELAWFWSVNSAVSSIETVEHGPEYHGPSVISHADLDAHTAESNPHGTTLEDARVAGDTFSATVRSALAGTDYRHLTDDSGGTNTNPYTLRFDGRNYRLFAGGVNGIGEAVVVDHDTGDTSVTGGLSTGGAAQIGGTVSGADPTAPSHLTTRSWVNTNTASSSHDNTDHSVPFVTDGNGVERKVWVIAAGAADPAGAGPDDIIFEKEA